jgi:hypothetical protein
VKNRGRSGPFHLCKMLIAKVINSVLFLLSWLIFKLYLTLHFIHKILKYYIFYFITK